ncbi:outer membrane protein assembly factor BamD [Pelotalea chapellei]|uniref:Outer membrane protein assembly factor BamD n=1 Tax=Pelotalea chapellei TaxID=44671 RepID=A0ABS5UAD9_9BACT|nr:outer membrane protein assembly factor BamD [Pelotalea chapellei]MBT1072639.1 outer membrane protein assembly factor BamD [Pelotalea chapellei]
MKTPDKSILVSLLALLLLQGCATPQMNKPTDVLYKDGEEFYQSGKYEDAIAQWKKVRESYQSPELTTRAELGIADAYFLNKDYIEAAAAYEDFRKLHPRHEKAEYALYHQALSHYYQVSRIDTDQTPVKNALAVFEAYLSQYPSGEFLQQVREKAGDCRDKQLQYEIYVGKFYLNQGKFPAAIGRFEEALKMFPDLPRRDEVLYYLGWSYLASGQKNKGREVYARLFKEFPASPHIDAANKKMDSFF